MLGIRHVVKSEPRYALQSVLDDERRERRHSRAEIGSSTDSLRPKRRRKAIGKVLPLRAERSDDFSGDASVANVGRVKVQVDQVNLSLTLFRRAIDSLRKARRENECRIPNA